MDSVMDALAESGLAETATVVLVGSAARGAMSPRSDIDVLVLHPDGQRIRLGRPGDIHLQQDSRSRFLRRLADGDDYPGWALRLGLPLRDPDNWWARLAAAELANPHWPDWRPKVDHARKRIRMATALLDLDDLDATAEELLFAASHVARAILLKNGTFPLSRPEMPSQLKTVDARLAVLLEKLACDATNAATLRSGASLLEQRLRNLSVASGAGACLEHRGERAEPVGRLEQARQDAAWTERPRRGAAKPAGGPGPDSSASRTSPVNGARDSQHDDVRTSVASPRPHHPFREP